MFLLNLKRISRFAWQGICRNKGLSLQVVFIMLIAVSIWTAIFFTKQAGEIAIEDLQRKIDIAVYFKKEVVETEIFEVRDELFLLSRQVESIDYISKDEALEKFLQNHSEDPLYMQALEEVESNPFLASLTIKAKEPNQYAEISVFLEEDVFKGLIDRISYNKNKQVIDKIFAMVSNIKITGLIIGLLLVILVLLITFNIIKLTVLSFKEELSTMRLVGASNWFIKGPFLLQGFCYALFAVVVFNVFAFSALLLFRTQLASWFFGLDFLLFFQQNLLFILPLQFLGALFLAGLSTLLALRKHLKV